LVSTLDAIAAIEAFEDQDHCGHHDPRCPARKTAYVAGDAFSMGDIPVGVSDIDFTRW